MQAPNYSPSTTPFVPYTPGKSSPGGASIGGGVGTNNPEDDKANTPGKMFTQTPPAGKRLDADGRPILVNRTSTRRRRSGTSPVVQLPAIPAKGSYSYGATNPVMPQNFKHAETSNSLKELLMRSTAIAKERTQARTRNTRGVTQGTREEEREEEEDDEDKPEETEIQDTDKDQSEVESVGSRSSPRPTRTPRKPKVVTQEELDAVARRRGTLRERSVSAQPDNRKKDENKVTKAKGKVDTVPEEPKTPAQKPSVEQKAARTKKTPLTRRGKDADVTVEKPKKPVNITHVDSDSNTDEEGDTGTPKEDEQKDESSYIPGEDTLNDVTFTEEDEVLKAWSGGRRAPLMKRLWYSIRRATIWARVMIEPVSYFILVFLLMTLATGFLVGRFPFPLPSWVPIPEWLNIDPWSRFGGGIDFTAPGRAPENMEALVDRLTNVERVLQAISGEQKSLSRNFDDISAYTVEIQSYTKTQSEESAMATSQINDLSKRYNIVKAQLDEHVKESQAKHAKSEDRADKLDFQVHNIHGGLLRNLKNELKAIQPKIDELMKNNKRIDDALSQLSSSLPENMPVRTGPNGEIVIRPEFYQHLRDFFRGELTKPDGAKRRDDSVDNRPYKWTEFLKQNEANLRAYIGDSQKQWWQKATKDQTVVSRQQFLGLLKAEVEKLDRSFNEKTKKLGQDIDNKVKGLEKELMKSGKGKNVGENLADSLYQHYSSKLVDYASYAGGAYIDPRQTSPTYDTAPDSIVYRMLKFITGSEHQTPRAKTAITPTTREAGICWPIPGKNGTLGLLLPQEIFVTDVTVEHNTYSSSPFKDTAPKNIELWIRIEDPKLREAMYEAATVALKSSNINENKPDPSKKYFAEYVRVAAFTYEFSLSASPIQTFSVPLNLKQLNASADKVVFRVTDNYGNPDFTCIYRFRIHGEPAGGSTQDRLSEGQRDL